MTKRIAEFDTWRSGYGGSVVYVYKAGTTDLADIFLDEALTQAAGNPQTLSSMAAPDGTRYGKFTAPIYTNDSYYLSIDGIENTGIIRQSFSSMTGVDSSDATVKPNGSTKNVPLDEFAALEVNAANFGELVEGSGSSAATNTNTIELAIAALSDGGFVNIPAGLYKVSSFSIPEGVIVRGQGAGATTLQSVVGTASFTIVGNNAGFYDITLDGNSLYTNSIGVKSENNDNVVFENVIIKRFETGMYFYGGTRFVWENLSIDNTDTAAKLFGEDAVFEDLMWIGGQINLATVLGVSMSYEDNRCQNINFVGVTFSDCTEYAVNINGAQNIKFIGCSFANNAKTINIQDDTATLTPATEQNNDVITVHFDGGRIDGGEFKATGTCQNVILKNMNIKDVEFAMTTPMQNYVVLQDCFEESGVTISGEPAKLIRSTTSNNGASFGVTTAGTATKAWSIALDAGQQVYLEAKVIAKGRNVVERAIYHIGCGAFRAGSELNYDTQTANFTAGGILTGQSSGATARIQADSDSGTTGTLTLTDITGEFLDNEIITDDSSGSATVNGTLTAQNAALDTTGNVNLRTIYETTAGFAAAFVANGPEIELRVTGASSNTLEWTVDVDVVST